MKEQAKKRNMELLAEQKLLISTGKQLKHEAENRFGAEIKHAADRIEAIEKEIGDTRQESVVLENDTRCVKIKPDRGHLFRARYSTFRPCFNSTVNYYKPIKMHQ